MDVGERKSKPNPREQANPLSALVFWWTLGLFREGYTKNLAVEDLYEPLSQDASQILGDTLEQQWKRQEEASKKTGRPPSLMRAIIRAFSWEYGKLGVNIVLSDVFLRLGQPLLLGKLLSYFTPNNTMPKEEAFLYAGGIILFSCLSTVSYNHYVLGAFHTGMRVRAACCSLIYRKSLRLSRTALGETAAGQVVNLLSNDVSRFDMVAVFLHYMWSSPIVAAIIAYFMYVEIGISAFVGIAVVFVVTPLQAYTSKLTSKFRRQTAFKTDERVRLMDEIVSGIQVIKMYAWEKPFAKLLTLARRLELKVVIKTSYIRGIFMMFGMCTTRIALFGTLITLVLTGNRLSADKVFVVLSYFNILSQTMSMMFVRGVQEIAETVVSIKRLKDFMMHDEYSSAQSPIGTQTVLSHEEKKEKEKPLNREEDAVVLSGATAKWDVNLTDPTLSNLNLNFKCGQLVGVIGQVGAGKSSLLQMLLGELPLNSGTCTVAGRVSYACQEPWVFAATVRQNIVFGQPFNRRRYNEAIRACALQRDFEQFPNGDLTVVGERGSSLSGGQKARINLARAVYNEADIYLLDDPLSAVDTHVGKHLFEECINTLLANKTRILVTHQLQYLSDVDHVIILNNGVVEMQGNFHDLSSTVDYAELLGVQEGTESHEASGDDQPEEDRQHTPIHQVLRQISTRSRSSEKESKEELREEDGPAMDMTEATSKGTTQGKSVYVEYFRSGANCCSILGLTVLFLLAQTVASGVDYFVAYWTSMEELRAHIVAASPDNLRLSDGLEPNITSTLPSSDHLLNSEIYVYIYTAFIISLFVIALLRSIVFYNMCIRCSENLHNSMFNSIIRTRMRFFDTNPSGRILNRFSKDIGSIDELLPKALLDATQIILMMVGCIIVSVVVNYLFLLPILGLSGIFWFVRRVYLKTSKNIKRIEGMTKSPVFTHLHATLQGLTTIRAYGAQDILRKEFDKHQDLHSSAWYMFLAASTAFGFALDVLCLIYISFVTFSFLFLEGMLGGQVGLAITQSMALTGMIQWGMRQSAEIANQMMAVERILEYTALEEEPKLESPPARKPPTGWPSAGQIQFVDTSLRYCDTEKPVLKELNLLIQPTEKVGIVGRTGAGKSSLIAALFRLAWVEGEVRIDEVDTKDIALQDLRSKISIIPQDPVLFSGTMRRNLDPFEEYADYVVWKAIEEVELKEALSDIHGLETRVAEGGSNFSVGQRQLVCLARAILRNNKILMLDEATANVDPHTDALIQKAIRLKFKDCTVLTVAHRLNTIMDSDKVLVMESGKMAEFDHPHILLQNEDSYFYKMVQETGKSMTEQLCRIAEESYSSRDR